MEKTKRIVLKPNFINEDLCETVRLTPEALKVVGRLRTKTGMTVRQLVSEIIIQSEKLIDIDDSILL